MISEWYRNSFLRFEGRFVYVLCTDLCAVNMFILLNLLEWLLKKIVLALLVGTKEKHGYQ